MAFVVNTQLRREAGDEINARELSFGDPIAYVDHISPGYYEYFSPVTGFPEGEWLVSSKESDKGFEITKKNSMYILKRSDVEDIPEWLAAEHAKFEG